MRTPSPPCTVATWLLLGQLLTPGRPGAGQPLSLHVVNFNFETVRVTWNASRPPGANLTFLYRFPGAERLGGCPSYVLRGGHTAGCVLPAPGDTSLSFSIRDGTRPVLDGTFWIGDFLKPASPRDLTFRWHRETLTVTCLDLPFRGLLYQVQHKSPFDSTWQSKEEESCNVTLEGLDTAKCYSIRARVTTLESSYGPDTYPSDWSDVAHLQGARRTDACRETPPFPKFVLVSGMVVFLTLLLAFLFLWKLRSVKTLLLPSVPDPKFTFPGLFEAHQGNFQEWIKDTQDVARMENTEDGVSECTLEEAPTVRPPQAPTPATGDQGDRAGDPQSPRKGEEEVVFVGGFTFVVSNSSYVLLGRGERSARGSARAGPGARSPVAGAARPAPNPPGFPASLL